MLLATTTCCGKVIGNSIVVRHQRCTLRQSWLTRISRINNAIDNAGRRNMSTGKSGSNNSNISIGKTTIEKQKQQQQLKREQYLQEAEETMKIYHDAKLEALKGNIKIKGALGKQSNRMQVALMGFFLMAFVSTPFIGKKIATDEEFRNRYVPSWYDYTIKKPTSAWTREELHLQILQIQREIRERAIRGDFQPDKIRKMRNYMEGIDREKNTDFDPDKDPHAWSKIHPGLDEDEDGEE